MKALTVEEGLSTLQSYPIVIGIDESGTGAFAGPFSVSCVVFNTKSKIDSCIKDCKKFKSTDKLKEAANKVKDIALFHETLVSFDTDVYSDILTSIDTFIINSIRSSINYLANNYSLSKEEVAVVIDGSRLPSTLEGDTRSVPIFTLPKADGLIPSVSAASILARHARDSYMEYIAENYPSEFEFKNNKGYGTKRHLEALEKLGPTDIHRKYLDRCKRK